MIPEFTVDQHILIVICVVNTYTFWNSTVTQRRETVSTYYNCDWCGKYIISDSALREHIERYIQERSPFNNLRIMTEEVANNDFPHHYENLGYIS